MHQGSVGALGAACPDGVSCRSPRNEEIFTLSRCPEAWFLGLAAKKFDKRPILPPLIFLSYGNAAKDHRLYRDKRGRLHRKARRRRGMAQPPTGYGRLWDGRVLPDHRYRPLGPQNLRLGSGIPQEGWHSGRHL